MKIKAACLLIPVAWRGHDADHSYFLTISRRDSVDMWGMPGGKLEPGESPIDGVIREIYEEIGIKIEPEDVRFIFHSDCHAEGVECETSTFMCDPYDKPLSILNIEHPFKIGLCTKEEMCDPTVSPFWEYNKKMFESISGI